MKIKKTIKIVGSIVLIIIVCNFIIKLYSNGTYVQPKSYSTIQEFENDTKKTVYGFYDLESYILKDQVVLLKDSSNYLSIGLQSNKTNETDYKIEMQKNGFYHYALYSSPFNENTDNMRKDVLGDGILYQYHFNDESLYGRYFVGIYVKDDFYYRIGFTENDLDISQVEQKIIEYIQLVENIS